MTLQNPLSYEQLLRLSSPCFKMFFEKSLNGPPTPTASFIATPSPSTTPPAIKILIIHISDDRQLDECGMISWGGRFSAVFHKYGIFMFIFSSELTLFNCVGHPCQKRTITISLNIRIALPMLPMALIIAVLTRLKSPNSPLLPTEKTQTDQ